MALTEKDVLYVADLAQLELTDEEVRKFVAQLNSILEHMQHLNRLDTSNVEPMAQVAISMTENSAVRADRTERSFSPERALEGAPESGGRCFKVPRVIDRG